MLRIRHLTAGYHGGTTLHGLDLDVPSGSVLALIGRNGAGKSTLIHAVAGLLRPYSGSVEVGDVDVAGWPAHRIAQAGVGLVPQGRRVFASLTVAEHLALADRSRDVAEGATWTVARVLEVFPRLAARLRHKGSRLSGGEQQMLAIGRALLGQPSVLLLDEATEGLAADLAARVRGLVADLARDGVTVLTVEQQLEQAIEVAHRVAVMDHGRIVVDRTSGALRADPSSAHAVVTAAGSPTPRR
jgi:branched-chain amino acid transport system ATP-binding protein